MQSRHREIRSVAAGGVKGEGHQSGAGKGDRLGGEIHKLCPRALTLSVAMLVVRLPLPVLEQGFQTHKTSFVVGPTGPSH